MRNSRVLGLLAVIAVIAALAFPPLWSVLRPDAHVRPSDAVGTPPQRVNPAPATGTLPAKARPTQAELTEILRNHGYMNISNPVAQPDGTWAAEAAKEFNGRKITVIVDRDRDIRETPPVPQTDSHP